MMKNRVLTLGMVLGWSAQLHYHLYEYASMECQGLNRTPMQVEIGGKNTQLIGMVETRIKFKNIGRVREACIPRGWKDFSNVTQDTSARIWVC